MSAQLIFKNEDSLNQIPVIVVKKKKSIDSIPKVLTTRTFIKQPPIKAQTPPEAPTRYLSGSKMELARDPKEKKHKGSDMTIKITKDKSNLR